MKPITTITFNGKEYPLYEIEHPCDPEEFGYLGYLTIGTNELLKELDKANMYHSRRSYIKEPKSKRLLREEAERVDSQIYCFMPSSVLEDDEEKVIEYFEEYFN